MYDVLMRLIVLFIDYAWVWLGLAALGCAVFQMAREDHEDRRTAHRH